MEELRDKNPFHCIITGPTNCGKTRYVIDQLRGSFRHVFEWIVLICPTYSKNKTYRGFAKGDKRFVVLSPDASNVEEINDLLGICEDFFSGKNTLIILDDCAVSKDLFGREKRSFFENNSRFVYCFCVNIMRMRTNDIDSNSFCVNIMIERKQVPEIDFVIASLRQKTFESYLNLSFMLV